jgi:hypothetical protein
MYFPPNGQQTMSGTLKTTEIRGNFFQEIKLKINHIVTRILVSLRYIMGSGFDSLIYWMSHVVTTVRCYTFKIAVPMAHKQL